MYKREVSSYSLTFESDRRLKPSLWQPDYCILRGLAQSVRQFSKSFAKPGVRVLDYGCGAKPYRPLFPDDCEYIGVDMCLSDYADIILDDGSAIPLQDEFFDLVLSTQVIYLIPEYNNYLMECHRLLKKQGVLLITSHGTWTYHPASGGDYYRFTQDGLRYILLKAGFEIVSIEPIVGTLGTGLHLRQLVFSSWFRKIHCSWIANLMNAFMNVRILFEDKLCPRGTRMSSPVIFSVVAMRKE